MTFFITSADGLQIAYETAGEGTPILLAHGFASDRVQNWKTPGWYEPLAEAGFRVVALDWRGHGESGKPHDPSQYTQDAFANDALRVLDAAHVSRAHLMGYSMGGMIAMHLLAKHAARFDRVIIGGVGGSYLAPPASEEARMTSQAVRDRIAEALLAPDASTITDPMTLGFRRFAEQAGKDRAALAACMRASRHAYTRDELARITHRVLVVCGENDDRTGRAEDLAAAFPNGRGVTVPRRDHMTTVGDKVFKHAVLEFLAE